MFLYFASLILLYILFYLCGLLIHTTKFGALQKYAAVLDMGVWPRISGGLWAHLLRKRCEVWKISRRNFTVGLYRCWGTNCFASEIGLLQRQESATREPVEACLSWRKVFFCFSGTAANNCAESKRFRNCQNFTFDTDEQWVQWKTPSVKDSLVTGNRGVLWLVLVFASHSRVRELPTKKWNRHRKNVR